MAKSEQKGVDPLSIRVALVIHSSQSMLCEEVLLRWANTRDTPPRFDGVCVYTCGFEAPPSIAQLNGVCLHRIPLSPVIDRYQRNPRPLDAWSPWGLASGPNWQFFKALRTSGEAHPESQWTFVVEPDVYVVCEHYQDELKALVSTRPDAWIVGGVEPTEVLGNLDPQLHGHINGSALYRTGDPDFQAFVTGVWIPSMLCLIDKYPTYPFDVVTSPRVWNQLPGNLEMAWRRASGRFFRVEEIVNASTMVGTIHGETPTAMQSWAHSLGFPRAKFLHTKWKTTSTKRLAKRIFSLGRSAD